MEYRQFAEFDNETTTDLIAKSKKLGLSEKTCRNVSHYDIYSTI